MEKRREVGGLHSYHTLVVGRQPRKPISYIYCQLVQSGRRSCMTPLYVNIVESFNIFSVLPDGLNREILAVPSQVKGDIAVL